MMLLASITDPIVNVAVDVVDALGLAGVFVLMVLESACIPVPSEATMLFAGFNVSDGHYSLFAAVAVGSVANLDMADRWFERRGERIVLIARCLPIIRTFISLPAGIARMPFWRFTIYTALGCVPWVLALTLVGVQVGSHWDTWHKRFEFLDYAVLAAIVAGIAYLVLRRRRGTAHA